MSGASDEDAWIGIDVGGTNIKSVLFAPPARVEDRGDHDRGDRVVDARTVPTRGTGPEQILSRIAGVAAGYRLSGASIAGVGVSLPGAVNRRTGVTGTMPNLPGSWSGVRARDVVAERTGLPTAVVNDARAFTVAEARRGAGRHRRIVVGVTLGTGLGNGIAVDGELLENTMGMTGGDLGHQVTSENGLPCACGGRGCVETRASTSTLCRDAGLPTVEAVFEAARRGESAASTAVEAYVADVAIALANVHTLVCPDLFVIGGGIAAAGAQLLVPLTAAVRALVRFDDPAHVRLAQAKLGHTAGALGAALLASTTLERAAPPEDR
ncbi:MAG: ROK family protein [Phycicoccus sp.]